MARRKFAEPPPPIIPIQSIPRWNYPRICRRNFCPTGRGRGGWGNRQCLFFHGIIREGQIRKRGKISSWLSYLTRGGSIDRWREGGRGVSFALYICSVQTGRRRVSISRSGALRSILWEGRIDREKGRNRVSGINSGINNRATIVDGVWSIIMGTTKGCETLATAWPWYTYWSDL